MKIYEIEEEIRNILEGITNSYGELDEVMVRRLEELERDKDKKLLSFAKYIKELEAEHAALKEAEDSIKERRVRVGLDIDKYKDYLLSKVDGKISDSFVSVGVRKSKRVQVLDPVGFLASRSDDRFFNTIKKINKVAIKAAIDSGESVEGASVEEFSNLVIK